MKNPLAKPLLLACTLLAALPGVASAQPPAWPGARPITLIVPYSAGGSVDFTARLVATKLGERLKQSVVIENVTGAGGAIGVAKAVNAAPDGYTLVAGPDSAIAIGRLINPAAFKFDPLKDLAPVAMLNTAPMVLVARPGLPAKDFGEFVKLAKASPGKFNYATSGVGTVLQLAMELLKERTGIFVTHVPYRGGAQIATDVIGNQVDLAMLVSTSAIPHVAGNRLQALGVTGSQRLANTPAPIVNRLNQALDAVLKDPEVRAKLQEQGALPGSGSPEDLGRFVKSEFARNQKIVQAANIKE
jgi:tripartite-type tricarboxylate transporter receptor subunit TctC